MVGLNLSKCFRLAVMRCVILLLVIFMAATSWAQTGSVYDITITPKNDSVGVGTTYLIFFKADSGLKSNDKILLYFPKGKGFDLSGVLVANNRQNLDGGFIVTVDTAEALVGLQRDGTGVDLAPDVLGSFRIAIVGNPTKPNSYNINIATQRGLKTLNSGFGTVTIKTGPLNHFVFANIGSQIADALFSFKLTAKDAYNNDRSLSNAPVNLSDNTGTLTPTSVTMNGSSVNIGNAKIAKGQSGVGITATANNGKVVSTSNAFGVNQIKILSIDTAPTTVSHRQQGIQVNMMVQNLGPDNVNVTGAQLRFKRRSNGNLVSGQYTITPSLPFPTIPGNFSTKTLRLLVAVNSGATTGLIDIDGSVNGNMSGVGTLSDTAADSIDSWTVQARPSLSYVATPTGLFPKQATPGGFFEFQVPIKNIAGAATLELKPDSTTFKFKDAGGDSFLTKLDANGGTQVVGDNSATTLIFRRALVPINIQQTTYAPQVKLIGTHNGVRLDTLLTLPNVLVVGQIPALQISEIFSSQDAVTQGMSKPWEITLAVKNNTSATINLQNTELSLVKSGTGGGPDTGYQISKPPAFKNSKNEKLNAGKTDSLEFQINKTGQITGMLAVFAKVFVKELPDPVASNGTQKSILVQTPAKLSMTLQTSQPKVTEGQTQRWQVIMKVKNDGEATVKAVFDDHNPAQSTRTSLMNAPGYKIVPAKTDITILGRDSTDIVFNVDSTGAAGNTPFDGQIFAEELNSDALHSAFANTQITVQTPARVVLDPPVLFEVYNGDTVNVGQKFLIKASVKQTQGTEKVDSVRIKLANFNGNNAAIFKDEVVLANNLTQSIFFELTANNVAPKKAQFRANIVAAYSANTGANTVLFDGVSKVVEAYIQQKGNLQFDKITTSENTVRFGRTAPWTITLEVSNPAPLQAGAVVIDSTIFTFKAGQHVQRDYTVEKVSPDSLLNAGKSKSLLFRVTKTGTTSGTVTITATVHAHNKNSREKITASRATSIVVESTALVTIAKTSFPASVNRVAGTDIALADTGQVFPISVTVRNTGFERVDKAWVTLSTKGPSKIINRQRQAGPIDTENGTAVATFTVKADAAVNSAGEIFTARLDSAKTALGKKVSVGLALDAKDTTAVVRLELPARLQLQISTNAPNDLLTTKQNFILRAVVQNLGQAQTDASGKLQIALPDTSFKLLTPPTLQQSFTVGDTVKWQIRAPLTERSNDALRVTMSPRPRSKNSGQFAQAADTAATLAVSTFNSLLRIDSTYVTAPAGAKDRVVSTEQFFTAGAKISASGNLTNKTATLTLPAGYNFRSGVDSTQNVPASGALSWEVQAPTDARAAQNLKVKVKALDGQSQLRTSEGALAITVRSRAILNLTPGISEPPGARNGILSVGQSLTLAATLSNTGVSNLIDTVIVKLDTGRTRLKINATLEQKIIFKAGSQVQTITWPATAPSQPNAASPLTFVIRRLPFDENTNKAAITAQNPVAFNLATITTGTLFADQPRITAPSGAKDRMLSTSQEFTVSDSLSWTNAANLTAELILPAGANFTFNPVQSLANANETGSAKVSWIVRAPAAPVNNVKAQVIFKAVDAHNNALLMLYTSDSIAVNVVQRAELSLSAGIAEPASATNGIVGIGQPFKVVATILNAAATGVYDTAKVQLTLPEGYTLIDTQKTALKAAKLPAENTFAWWVRARADISETADLLKFKLIQPPRDENTDAFAAISDDQTELNVRAEGRKLLVEDLHQGGGPAVRGGQNVLLARLQLLNPARSGSSDLMLKRLSFDLLNRAGKPLSPNSVFKAVRVVHEKGPNTIPGGENIALPADNPIAVTLSTEVSVSPDQPDTIAIVADLVENTSEQNFRLLFDDSQDFEVEDQAGGNGVAVETADGKRGNKFRLESNLTSLHGADAASAFFNYPNPFQPGDDLSRGEGTRFNLPAGASGELKIFTMLGELVWESAFEARNPLGVQGIFWNGHNGAGKRILNGVYLAILKTKDGKMATTKVAVLKK